MRNKGWVIFQIIQLLLFLGVSIFLFTRTVDGHGAIQTLEAKLISFAVWGIFFLVILAVEWIIFFIARRTKR
ncbi:MAG: DUF3923 family protein [Anaerovoracaceae bacterium]